MGFLYRYIENFLNRIKQNTIYGILNDFKGLVGLIIFYVAFFPPPFSSPQLSITYEIISLHPTIIGDTKPAWSKESKLLTIQIKNNKNREVSDFDISLFGFEKVTKVTFYSNSSKLMAEANKITYHEIVSPNLIYFPNIQSIPPQATLSLQVWGSFISYPMGSAVRIKSSADRTNVRQISHASGIGLFIHRNQPIISVIIVLFLFLFGLHQFHLRQIKNHFE